MNWQPIETAPMDGTEVLIWDGWSMEIASWDYDDLFEHGSKHWIYGQCSGEYNVYQSVDSPTHWMPLPESPPKT